MSSAKCFGFQSSAPLSLGHKSRVPNGPERSRAPSTGPNLNSRGSRRSHEDCRLFVLSFVSTNATLSRAACLFVAANFGMRVARSGPQRAAAGPPPVRVPLFTLCPLPCRFCFRPECRVASRRVAAGRLNVVGCGPRRGAVRGRLPASRPRAPPAGCLMPGRPSGPLRRTAALGRARSRCRSRERGRSAR